MSITSSMHNALSGLAANSRAAELVSSNVANAMTEGYAARSLELSSRSLGGDGSGVRVDGITRHADEVLIGDRRLTDAALGHDSTKASYFTKVEGLIGTPDDAGSLAGRIAKFESALIEASASPDSEARLMTVHDAATSLTSQLGSMSKQVQNLRLDADQRIALQVDQLNTGLKQVEQLNVKIRESASRGVDPSGLMDLRQQTIDSISSILPLKQFPRENGMVALATTGGAIVLDGKAAQFEFTPVNVIVPEMTTSSGALSGLTMNGQAVRTEGDRSPIKGGTLAAQFEIRDEIALETQSQLDAVARDLVDRFQDPALDSTRAPGAAGLFTDAGSAFDPLDEIGLSSRIEINAVVDPDQGGELWRIRDGLGAAVPGDVGNGTLLNAMSDALEALRAPTSGVFLGASRSASGLATDFLSQVSAKLTAAETQVSFSASQNQTLKQMELSKGVDTDAEMQKLMMIEQAFAANARVITTADEMIQTILNI